MVYKCPKCKQEKPISEFHKSSTIKRGHQYTCKVCLNKQTAERRLQRIEMGPTIQRDSKVCRKCNNLKPISQFGNRNDAPDGHMSYCKPCWVKITQNAQARSKQL